MTHQWIGNSNRYRWVAVACALLLSGCGPLASTGVPYLGQVEALTVVGTDKTIVDHVVSLTSGKNCSSVRREQGLYYCEEDEPNVKPEVYCYHTLGSVTCYDRPDPHDGRYQKVGENGHNLVKARTRR